MDILDNFKNRRWRTVNSSCNRISEIFFMIDFDIEGHAVLKVCDNKGNIVDVDYRNYSGSSFQLLRSLETVRESIAATVSWLPSSEGVRIDEHPQLLYLLLRCDNIIDNRNQALTEEKGLYSVNVNIMESGNNWTPEFILVRNEGNGPFIIPDFKLITDSYALAGESIVEIKLIGEEYSKLRQLERPFVKDIAEQFLSVLMSHFDNVGLSIKGIDCETSQTAATVSPAIIFEKVSEDNALYLRLSESIKGVPVKFVEDFSPTRIVDIQPDGGAVIKPVIYPQEEASAQKLMKLICSCAPSKQDAKEVYENDGLFIIPEATAGPFLINSLSSLAKEYILIGSDSLTKYKIKQVKPKFKFTASSGIDFLEGFADIEIDDYVFSLSDFLAQYRKNSYIELSDGEKGIIDENYIKRIERLIDKQKKGKKLRLSFFDMPEVEALMEDVPDTGLFKKSREFYEGFNKLQESSQLKIKGLDATLRPYQENGIKWLYYLYENNLGGCLADDMGLGKTVQTIGLLLLSAQKRRKAGKPTLIVMPRTLLFNWYSELKKFAQGLTVSTYYGPDRDLDKACASQVILTTYALVRNDIESFREREFDCIVLDESQNIKNITAKVTQAVMMLKSGHRFALSGTPLENRLSELYSLFRFLNPGMFGSADDFNSRYAVPIQKDADKEAMQQLKSRIAPFLLRRVKEDVLKDLPERINQTIYVEMDEAQKDFYETRRRQYYESIKNSISKDGTAKAQFEMFQALNELRRIASVPESLSGGEVHSAKIPAITESLVEAVENGHKVVVFFNFIAGIELLGEELEKGGIGYVVMTGATSDRQSVVDRFQNDRNCHVMLMTLKTGGTGLNLTAADTVFIAEPWWNKAAEEQAVGRLHRIGQKSVVHSFSVITAYTIEERILQLQQQKALLADELISSDSSTAKVLSEEDIDFILG